MLIRGDGYVVERKARVGKGKKTKPTGRWQIRMPYPGGKIDRCGGTKKQAQVKHRRLLMCREQGLSRAEALSRVLRDAAPESYSLNDIADAYLEGAAQDKRSKTVHNERLRVEQLRKTSLGSAAVRALTRSMVQDYLRGRIKSRVGVVRDALPADMSEEDRSAKIEKTRRAAQKTANRFIALLSSICQYAEDQGVVPVGFWRGLGVRRYSEDGDDAGVYLTSNEVDRLIAAVPAWLSRIVDFATAMGLRRGEIVSLRWRHIDFDARTVRVEQVTSKSRRGRTIKMPLRIFGLLQGLRGDGGLDDAVFLGRSGEAIKGDTLTQAFIRQVRAGIKGVPKSKTSQMRLHDTRHTCASLMLGGGASIYEVRDALGHRSVKTTEKYARFIPKAADNAATAMDRARSRGGLSG